MVVKLLYVALCTMMCPGWRSQSWKGLMKWLKWHETSTDVTLTPINLANKLQTASESPSQRLMWGWASLLTTVRPICVIASSNGNCSSWRGGKYTPNAKGLYTHWIWIKRVQECLLRYKGKYRFQVSAIVPHLKLIWIKLNSRVKCCRSPTIFLSL